jgi:hypothetical protein
MSIPENAIYFSGNRWFLWTCRRNGASGGIKEIDFCLDSLAEIVANSAVNK